MPESAPTDVLNPAVERLEGLHPFQANQSTFVTFDGHQFLLWGNAPNVPFFYLAYHARRGDIVAAELLTLFKITIHAENGTVYWPMSATELFRPVDGRNYSVQWTALS